MSGKSTVARAIASHIGFTVISTDDLGIAARAVTTSTSHSDLHAFAFNDHHEYFLTHGDLDLLSHAQQAHRALWPAIRSVIQAHSAWAMPAVIEGWAILPDLVSQANFVGVSSVWLGTPELILESRVRGQPSFWSAASNPELMIERFVGRSMGFASWLQSETVRRGLSYVTLTGAESPEHVAEICLTEIEQQIPDGGQSDEAIEV